MKSILIILLLFSIIQNSHSQVEFLSSGSNGELILSTTTGCCERSLGIYRSFIDIAVTPDGTIYGLDGDIFLIDTSNITATSISTPIDQYGNYAAGAGLVAIDNEFLISDRDDSLFLIEISTGIALNIGKTGYYCNGDFAFFNEKLYMSADPNDLIRINLDPVTYSITETTNIGSMSQYGSVYSLFTTFQGYGSTDKALYAIDGFTVYKVNTIDASTTAICTFESSHDSFGGASIYDFNSTEWNQVVPNVFTPNNDGVNDYFMIPKSYNVSSFNVINRWGNMVFSWQSGEKKWDGRDMSNNEVSEGVYFYILEIGGCDKDYSIQGSLTLLR